MNTIEVKERKVVTGSWRCCNRRCTDYVAIGAIADEVIIGEVCWGDKGSIVPRRELKMEGG